MEEKYHTNETVEGSLTHNVKDPLIRCLNKLVVWCVKILAVLMVFVIFLALADVFVHIYKQIFMAFPSVFGVEDLISVLGSFLAVLIAIEIFLNIVFYLKQDAIHVPLVLATALTAAARKVIIIDYTSVSAITLFALACIIFALGLSYWLIASKSTSSSRNIDSQ